MAEISPYVWTIPRPAAREVGVVWQDEQLLAVDKPSGLLMAPDRWDKKRENLMALLLAGIASGESWAVSRGIHYAANAHRLDFDTSGLVLVALSRTALASLVRQFRTQAIRKTYVALVEGTPPADEFVISASIGDDPRRPGRSAVVRRGGKPASTAFRVLQLFRGFAWLEACPQTGRQHQIRVHLQHAGCPIVADRLYGSGKPLYLSTVKRGYQESAHPERPLLGRLGLHALRLAFKHPASGAEVCVEAPLPKDLAVAVKQLAKYARLS